MLLPWRLLSALFSDLISVKDKKVDLADDDLVCQRVLGRDRVFRVVARLEHLLVGLLEHFEKKFDQIWSVEVMEVLLAKV